MILSFVRSLDSSVNEASRVLTQGIFVGDMYDFAIRITQYIRPIAITILGLCFVLEFLKIIIHAEILKWETGLKVGAKLILTYVALDITPQLMEAIYATGQYLTSMVAESTHDIGSLVATSLHNALNDLSLLQAIGMIATVGIAFLVVWLAGIVILVLAYARSIELLLHIAISPLPCAFILLEDHHGSRIFWKFVMSFAANCLQGLFIVLSIALYDVMVIEILETALEIGADLPAIAGSLLLGAIVLVVCVVKSGSVAKQILDV